MPYGENDSNFWKIIGLIIAVITLIVAITALWVSAPQLPTTPIFEGRGGIDTDGNYEISWDSSERAIFYILQESGNSSFVNSITVHRGSVKNAYIYGRPNGVYYYRVKGGNEAGESGWSATRRISVSISLPTGSITVSSSPAGASIYLDGEYMGNTPQTITGVSQGAHSIELRLEGYERLSDRVQVMAGETSYVEVPVYLFPTEPSTEPSFAFEFTNFTKGIGLITTEPSTEPSTGAITVSSPPVGASIYLDDRYRGSTPQTITAVSPGTHTIELRLEGYEGWSTSVQVMAGGTTYVDATLTHITTEPSTGTITVASSPVGASIYLDDEYMGNTPQTITGVSQGAHNIELRLEGYEGWSESVQAKTGETTYVDATLIHTPTPTPTPTSGPEQKPTPIPTPTPPVTVKITEPKDGGDFPLGRSTIVGTLSNVPDDQHLWIVLSKSNGRHYPFDELYIRGDTWEVISYGVGEDNIEKEDGDTFIIGAYLLDERANKEFEQYVEEIEDRKWGGLDSLPEGATRCDEIEVIGRRVCYPPIILTYHDFGLNDVCTPEDNYCGWANAPGKAVVYGSMTTGINVPEGASELEVTISISCNGYGEGLSGQPGSAAYIRVDSEERAERIDSTMPSHHGNYYRYEWCDTFSNSFNVRGGEEITLIIEMSGGARLDFEEAILTFS